jgi:hypothetical protein
MKRLILIILIGAAVYYGLKKLHIIGNSETQTEQTQDKFDTTGAKHMPTKDTVKTDSIK